MKILSLLLLLLRSQGFSQGPSDLEKILKRGELIVAFHGEDSPPFFYRDSKGKLAGIDPSLARIAAQRLGVRLKFIQTAGNYKELLAQIKSGRADISLSALYPSLERATEVLFTDPYLDIPPVLAVNRVKAAKTGLTKNRLENLGDGSIGVYDYPFYCDWARRKFPMAGLVKYSGHKKRGEMLNDLLGGKIAAAFMDKIEFSKWAELKKDLPLFVEAIEMSEPVMPAAMAVSSDSIHLYHWLNLFILNMRRDGVIRELAETAGI